MSGQRRPRPPKSPAKACRERRQVSRCPRIVLTHAHEDHWASRNRSATRRRMPRYLSTNGKPATVRPPRQEEHRQLMPFRCTRECFRRNASLYEEISLLTDSLRRRVLAAAGRDGAGVRKRSLGCSTRRATRPAHARSSRGEPHADLRRLRPQTYHAQSRSCRPTRSIRQSGFGRSPNISSASQNFAAIRRPSLTAATASR